MSSPASQPTSRTSLDTIALPGGRAALVVGHPGHELRVHRWLELARPVVCVLTDGSGHGEAGRLASTDQVVRAAGASAGSIYGRLSDRQVYDTLVGGNVATWITLAHELTEQLRHFDVDYVVADAAEGFNPTHDLCRYLVDAAIARLSRESGRALRAFEFDLDAAPGESVSPGESPALRIDLDEDALDRKIQAALGYTEMRSEVDAILARFGGRAFSVEAFRLAHSGATQWPLDPSPEYERHGRNRIASGIYHTLITYRTHLEPVQTALAEWSRQ